VFPEFADIVPKSIPAPPTAPMATVPAPGTSVPNYLVQAILCTLCCCLPFGIVAIVYSSQVNSKLLAGDYDGAQESSKKARLWCWLSFGFGIALYPIWIALELMMGAVGSSR
jgi:hypothetical protein